MIRAKLGESNSLLASSRLRPKRIEHLPDLMLGYGPRASTMNSYTVRKLPTGELYGSNLTVTQAAMVVLSHAVTSYDIRRGEGSFYWLWIETDLGTMEIARNRGRPIGARAETRRTAWLAIASQVIEAEWPGLGVWGAAKSSLRVVRD